MKKIEILKTGVGAIVTIGVGAIIGNAIKSTTPPDVKTITKICIGVGAFVLGSMCTDKAVAYVDGAIDEVVEGIKEGYHKDTTSKTAEEEET